jgi:hypothetical protein
MPQIANSRSWAGSSRKLSIAVEVAVNFLFPLLVYHFTKNRLGETNGLLLSSIPPIVWSIFGVIRFRRLDAVSVIVVLGILISLGVFAMGGSPRTLLVRESLITGVVGVLLLGSLVLPRPLMFYVAQATAAQHSPEDALHFGTLWERPSFVKCMYRLTLVWGLGLVLEACVRVGLAWRIPIEQFLIVSPIIAYAAYFSLFGWTFWFVRKLKAADGTPSAPTMPATPTSDGTLSTSTLPPTKGSAR